MDTGTVTNFQHAAIAAQTTTDEQGVIKSQKSELGMDDFFKLLTTQLVSQDPLEPLADTEFIAQMANFSSLTQMENIAEDMAGVRGQQEALAVMSLIGKEIKADTGEGSLINGTVTHVKLVGEEYVPFVGDILVPYRSIIEVRAQTFLEPQIPSSGGESAAP